MNKTSLWCSDLAESSEVNSWLGCWIRTYILIICLLDPSHLLFHLFCRWFSLFRHNNRRWFGQKPLSLTHLKKKKISNQKQCLTSLAFGKRKFNIIWSCQKLCFTLYGRQWTIPLFDKCTYIWKPLKAIVTSVLKVEQRQGPRLTWMLWKQVGCGTWLFNEQQSMESVAFGAIFSVNILLQRVEFGIRLKHRRQISEGCLRLTPQHLLMDPFCSGNGVSSLMCSGRTSFL